MSGEMQPQAASRPAPVYPAWMQERLREIEDRLADLLAAMPESLLEAQQRAAECFGMTPSAGMLQALVLMARDTTPEEIRAGQGRTIATMRLLVDQEIHALTEAKVLDLDVLARANTVVPDLIHHLKDFHRQFDWVPDLGPRDLEQLDKFKKSLMPDIKDLQALAVLVPRVMRLARAAQTGELGSFPFLEKADVELFQAALPGESETPPNRICLDATALRWAIQEDLDAWNRIRPVALEADEVDEEPGDGPFGARELRLAILEHLKLEVNAYHALMKRMQAQQDRARNEGADDLVQETSAAQRALFTVYLELTATVRNPAGKAATDDDEAAAAARDRLLREIQEVEDAGMAPGEDVKEEVLLEALTALRDRHRKAPEVRLPESVRNRKREILRRNILIGLTGVLAVVAVVVNVALMSKHGPPPPIQAKASEFSSALPVKKVAAMGPMMFSEVPSWSWKGLAKDERLRKVQEIGRIAEQKGFQGVFLVDDNKKELATWSVRGGPRLLGPSSEP